MGQKRVSLVDLSQEETTQKISQKRASKSAGKTVNAGKAFVKTGKRAGRLADKGEPLADVILEEPSLAADEASAVSAAGEAAEKARRERKPKERGRRYKFALSLVDRNKLYPIEEAIDLVKKTSIARFDGTISAHLNLTEDELTVDVPFPHSTGKKMRIALASDELIGKIEAKQIDFDVLLSTPEMMKRLVKVAKILGPLGLMPNPKAGTISDNPEKRKRELESGTTQVRSESKSPLMHVVIGKTTSETKALAENLQALVTAVRTTKLRKLTLASTMSPGVKVDLSVFQKPS